MRRIWRTEAERMSRDVGSMQVIALFGKGGRAAFARDNSPVLGQPELL
jgi:hypothetical protein